MKISKVFTGLVVCGALIFPGALSSSAKDIDSSDFPESVNYSTEQETEQSITYRANYAAASYISNTKYFTTYQGPSVYNYIEEPRPIPQAPAIYSGTLYYNLSESTVGRYAYTGKLFLQN
ncbi:hypothetical protein FOH38_01590 [Lysinibacillus fusiformis]|nr:hypothetical protein FOH38_01590 [Lysinibacillus fusiformis]